MPTYAVTLEAVNDSTSSRTVQITADNAVEAERGTKVPGWLTVCSERLPDGSQRSQAPGSGGFVKVRFVSKQHGATAGLIFPDDEVQSKTVAQLSRYFPVSEFWKMKTLWVSNKYDTWEEAFAHKFA